MIAVSAADRAAAGLVAGDTADIELRLDTDVREVDRAPDFTDALSASPRALEALNALSYSRQRWFALNIEAAKTSATRARRIDQAIGTLESDDGGRTPRSVRSLATTQPGTAALDRGVRAGT